MDGETEEELAPRCRLSDPAHPHFLCRRDNPRPSLCFRCGPIGENDEDLDWNNWHYHCDVCKVVFHECCYFAPQGMRHPYHPNHPLYFTIRFSETRIQSFKNDMTEVSSLTIDEPILDQDIVFETDNTCGWCGLELGSMFFRCLDCNFSLGAECIRQDPPFAIANLEKHEHPLTLFPRPLVEPCSACGLGGNNELGYVCEPCNYLIHRKCIEPPSHKANTSSVPSI